MPPKKKAKQAEPEYELTYWNVRGRAEPIRLTLTVAGLKWKEVHLNDELYADLKKKAGTADLPFGQWPTLKEGDVVLSQTQAICKHIARKHGMYGARNKMEDYIVDAVMLGCDELRHKFYAAKMHENKEKELSAFEKNHLDPESKIGKNDGAHLAYLEGFLERSETPWVAGGKNLSVADIFLFTLYEILVGQFDEEKIKKNYPKIAENVKALSEVEEVAEYLKGERFPN